MSVSIPSGMDKRLTEIENDILELIDKLKNLSGKAETRNLNANKELQQLAESTKVAVQALVDVRDGFKDAVEILRISDPTRATEAIASVDERLKGLEKSLLQVINDAAADISIGQKKVEKQVSAEGQSIQKSVSDTVAGVETRLNKMEQTIQEKISKATVEISSGLKIIEQQLKEEGQLIRKTIPSTIDYITCGLIVLILVVQIFFS